MTKPAYHRPTTTLKMPIDAEPAAELRALQAAGIPVDERGRPKSGFLHMRTTQDYRHHIFRWFANGGPTGGFSLSQVECDEQDTSPASVLGHPGPRE